MVRQSRFSVKNGDKRQIGHYIMIRDQFTRKIKQLQV